jgi:hypothetical protein
MSKEVVCEGIEVSTVLCLERVVIYAVHVQKKKKKRKEKVIQMQWFKVDNILT